LSRESGRLSMLCCTASSELQLRTTLLKETPMNETPDTICKNPTHVKLYEAQVIELTRIKRIKGIPISHMIRRGVDLVLAEHQEPPPRRPEP